MTNPEDQSPGPLNDAVEKAFAALVDRIQFPQGHTGLKDVDAYLGNVDGAQFVVLASQPSAGRTTFLGQWALHRSDQGPIAFYSIDLPAQQMLTRMLFGAGYINWDRIVRTGGFTEQDAERAAHAAAKLAGAPLHLVDAYAMSPEDIAVHAQELHAQQPLMFVAIDGLELLGVMDEQAMHVAALRLWRLSRELGCPVVVTLPIRSMAPLKRPNHRPMLSDLDWPAVTGMAHSVLAIYRDEMYNPETEDHGIADILFLKQKNGPTGKAQVVFSQYTLRFSTLAMDV